MLLSKKVEFVIFFMEMFASYVMLYVCILFAIHNVWQWVVLLLYRAASCSLNSYLWAPTSQLRDEACTYIIHDRDRSSRCRRRSSSSLAAVAAYTARRMPPAPFFCRHNKKISQVVGKTLNLLRQLTIMFILNTDKKFQIKVNTTYKWCL